AAGGRLRRAGGRRRPAVGGRGAVAVVGRGGGPGARPGLDALVGGAAGDRGRLGGRRGERLLALLAADLLAQKILGHRVAGAAAGTGHGNRHRLSSEGGMQSQGGAKIAAWAKTAGAGPLRGRPSASNAGVGGSGSSRRPRAADMY